MHYNYYRYYDPALGRYLTPDPIGLAGGFNPYVYCLNDPVNLIDPFGLEFSDILPGIKKAIVEGAKGGTYAVGEAAKATTDLTLHGDPLAQTVLGVAFVSEAVPLVSAAAITTAPSVISAIYLAAPYSGGIVDFAYGFFVETDTPKGWGYLSSGALTMYDAINRIVSEQSTSACEK